MLSGKLPTASLSEPDEPRTPVGPTITLTPVTEDQHRNQHQPRSQHQHRNHRREQPQSQPWSPTQQSHAGAADPGQVEQLAAENERLRERVGRERERRNDVVEHYERMLDRRDVTSVTNGRKRAGPDDPPTEEGPRAFVGALRDRIERGVERVGRLL